MQDLFAIENPINVTYRIHKPDAYSSEELNLKEY